MTDVQKRVQEAIDQLVESGAERGVQVAVYRDGEPLVDAVAGVADPATGRQVTAGTPFYNFSIGKGATAAVAHVLAERGRFGYDTPVADLWPEFGAHGKHTVTVRQVAGPLGVADELYFGMPESEHGRLAPLEDAPGGDEDWAASMPADLPMFKAGPMALMPTATLGNRADILAADIPAGCKTSARAIARMYAAMLGEVDGVRLISPERLRQVTAIAASGVDQVYGNPSTWGLGYSIGRPGATAQESPTAFGMGGAGGSFAYGDTATGIAFAVTKNRLTADFSAVNQLSGIVTNAVAGTFPTGATT